MMLATANDQRLLEPPGSAGSCAAPYTAWALRRGVCGTIRRRLLVNATVDPDEVSTRLPGDLRPHATSMGTVVGCCLLDIEAIRPVLMPAALGRQLRAAAHRISVEWEDLSGATRTGVYVPTRHTDSRLAGLLGGRLFPGVHEPAAIDIDATGTRLAWSCVPTHAAAAHTLRITAEIPGGTRPREADGVGRTCLGADLGLSPGRRGPLEAARMIPEHRRATAVGVTQLRSAFIDTFATAEPATAYLMRDVDVVWTPADSHLPVAVP